MSKLGKISFLICGLCFVILIVARLILGGWINYLYVPLALSVIFFFTALFADLRFYREFFTMRTTKHGMNMGTLILGALVLAAALNYFGVRFDHSWDLTAEKLHSLSDQSQKVLDGLKGDVIVRVFYRGAEDLDAKQKIREALQIYLDSSSKVKVEYVNSYAEAGLAKEYLKAGDQVGVFAELNGRRIQIEQPYGEEQITSALIKVTRDSVNTVFFLVGHGEKDIDDTGPDGLGELKSALESSNYKVAKINLLKGDVLPNKDSVVAIVGPQTPYLETELEALRKFMHDGGKIFIAADPGQRHQLALLTKSFGVEFRNNYVLNDRVRLLGVGMAAVLGLQFNRDSDVTKSFADSENYALFMLASEVAQAPDAPTAYQYKDLVSTENQAFAVNDLKSRPAQVERHTYPIGISVMGSHTKAEGDDVKNIYAPGFAAVVFGDSDFLTDRILFQGVNRDLALNIFGFLVNDEGLISIRPKRPEGTQMTMTQTGQIMAVIAGISLPLVLIILSGVFWMRRKGL